MKKLVAFVLSIAMVLCVFPATAFANEPEPETYLCKRKAEDDSNGYLVICDTASYAITEDVKLLTGSGVNYCSNTSLKINAVPKYGYMLEKISVTSGGSTTDYTTGCSFNMPETEVVVSASFVPVVNTVELSEHTKMLLEKLIEFTGDTKEQAVESVSYYFSDNANVPSIMVYPGLIDDTYPTVQNKSEDPYRYAKTIFYVSVLGLNSALNRFCLEADNNLDTIKCVINNVWPLAYKVLDLIEAYIEQDYPNIAILAQEVSEDRANLCGLCFSEDRGCFEAMQDFLTDNSVNGNTITNPKDAYEKYAECICTLFGSNDPAVKAEFRQYADEWLEKDDLHFILNYIDSLKSSDDISAMNDAELRTYVQKSFTGIILSSFYSLLEDNYFDNSYYSDCNVIKFSDKCRCALDHIIPLKVSMIALLDAVEENSEGIFDYGNFVNASAVAFYEGLIEFNQNFLDFDYVDTDWGKLYQAFENNYPSCRAFEVSDQGGVRTIKLLRNITCAQNGIYSKSIVASGVSIVLDLNGYVLNRGLIKSDGTTTVNASGSAIVVEPNASVTIIDSNPQAQHKFTEYSNGLLILDEASGTVAISGGCITGGTGSIYNADNIDYYCGGGICNLGTLNVAGGNIVGNTAQRGGGVFNNSSLNITNGNIEGCTTYHVDSVPADGNGGGVYNALDFTMSKGSVVSCFAFCGGGGVYNEYYLSTFNFNGGEIKNCIAGGLQNSYGGGIYNSLGKVYIDGGIIDSCKAPGNSGLGGGIYNLYYVEMKSGAIKNCETPFGGGGLCNAVNPHMDIERTEFKMSGGLLSGCKSVYGGAIYNFGGSNPLCLVSLSGNAKFTDNYAADNGGAVSNAGELIVIGNVLISNNYGGIFNENIMTVGKNPQIKDNEKYDLYLAHNISLGTESDAPSSGMYVGVKRNGSGAEGEIANGTADQVKYFFADDPLCQVKYDSGVIKLAKITSGNKINVCFDENGIVYTDKQVATSDDAVTLNVMPSAGYMLDSLTVTKLGGETVSVNNNVFIMPNSVVTVTALFKLIPAPVYEPDPTVEVPVFGSDHTIEVQATLSGKTARIQSVSDTDIEKIIRSDVATGIVEFDLTELDRVTNVYIPTKVIEKIADATKSGEYDAAGFRIKLPGAEIEFNAEATQKIAEQAKGSSIRFVIESIKESSLNSVQKKAVESFDKAMALNLSIYSNGKEICTEELNGFDGGKATVILPYELKNYKTPAYYKLYYVDKQGKLELLEAEYDKYLESFIFETDHFSNYVLAYDEEAVTGCEKNEACPASVFEDVDLKSWYHDGVHFCIANEIMNGVGENRFAPTGTISRAELVTMLWRLEGRPFVDYLMFFEDIDEEAFYAEAVRWAAAENIIGGYTTEQFGPTDPITREQIATILERYAEYKGEDIAAETEEINTLSYDDIFEVSEWAQDGMHYCIATGIIEGNDEKVRPQDNCSRAEAATMLYRFCNRNIEQ